MVTVADARTRLEELEARPDDIHVKKDAIKARMVHVKAGLQAVAWPVRLGDRETVMAKRDSRLSRMS